MRRLAVALLRWLAEALVRLYYPRRSVQGAGYLPPGGPALFVANHPNGLLDPLVLRVVIGRPVRFLAKSTLWGNPFGRLAMDAFQCLPVYRQQDAGQDAGQDIGQDIGTKGSLGEQPAGVAAPPARSRFVQRNEETFARCRAELAAGAELALYPEGTSHSDPALKPLKSGAARIALSAAAQAGASGMRNGTTTTTTTTTTTGGAPIPMPVVVPVGTHYDDKVVFRSGVHLVIGPSIDLDDHLRKFEANQKEGIESLTADIRARLNELVLQAETRELLAGIARVASWTAADADDDSPQRRHARTHELLAAYRHLKARDPARLEQVAETARRYARTLEQLGVRDPWALEAPRVSPGSVLVSLVKTVVMLPAASWGALTSWVPYRLSGLLSARLTRDEDVLSTIKMIVGFTVLVATWLAEAGFVGWRWGAGWGAATLLFAPLAGYAALRLGETLHEVAEAVRHLGWRRRGATVHHLAERRRRLADEVAGALREASR
ncbi:MAG: 1-acyl-sn-glycerol-3-phosphate acyltransferase [Myxococcales bacterium]